MKMDQTECSETAARKIQTPGNNPEKGIKLDCEFIHNVSTPDTHIRRNKSIILP
jgi:hypothetical protein